ncbi:MAG: diguanylate cyclase [Burkholderiales bacterium]|nr:diguanylate cyclase [Burkholderiales bacterium]MDE2457173.1 diguanylate cyclase [Burkholderiales bacterium]
MTQPRHRLLDILLTTQPLQRARLVQASLALLLMFAGVIAMHYFVHIGVAKANEVWAWTWFAIGGIGTFFAAIRSGWSQRFADPSLTVVQMLYAITCCAAAYMLVGAGRGGVFPIVMVILMFGMFIASPRQMTWVSVYAVASFGAAMAVMAMLRPRVYVPAIELGHFIMVATMMPAVSILAARLARLRETARIQRAELSAALARIRELATRDELTGLVNHSHLRELMAQEHQRCVRSGHTFCVAVLEIDDFEARGRRLGPAGGDELLRVVARESLRYVRVADVLARWAGERFVLLMSDTRAVLARGGLERLREKIADTPINAFDPGLRISLSAGLAEHHAGETVAQTLMRAESALDEAKAHGRDRVALS